MSERAGFRTVGSRSVLDLAFLSVQVRDVRTPSGETVERVVIAHPGAVAIVPRIGDDVVLIEQYRAAADAVVLEVPAGKLDHPADGIEETARRELLEETGLVAGELTWLTEIWASVGFTDERVTIFLADVVSEDGRAPVGLEEEEARVVRLPMAEAVERVREGTISDGKTVVGLLLASDEHVSAP